MLLHLLQYIFREKNCGFVDSEFVKICHEKVIIYFSFNLPVDVCPALQSFFKIAGACFQSLKRIERKKIKLRFYLHNRFFFSCISYY